MFPKSPIQAELERMFAGDIAPAGTRPMAQSEAYAVAQAQALEYAAECLRLAKDNALLQGRVASLQRSAEQYVADLDRYQRALEEQTRAVDELRAEVDRLKAHNGKAAQRPKAAAKRK